MKQPVTPRSGSLLRHGSPLDFSRLYALHQAGGGFIIRAKSNIKFERRYSHATDSAADIICDQMTGHYSAQHYPVRYGASKQGCGGKTLIFLINAISLSAQTIADLYRSL